MAYDDTWNAQRGGSIECGRQVDDRRPDIPAMQTINSECVPQVEGFRLPLFLGLQLLFIHIPKCGGDTLTHYLREHGHSPFLFVEDGSVMVNGHTPQHMTWREMLQAGWGTRPGFRVVALVRHPVERVISEYHYIKAFRHDLLAYVQSPPDFLDAFLEDTASARSRFDNHNVSMLEFLQDEDGVLDPSIEIYPVGEMDSLVRSLELPPVPIESRKNVTRKADNASAQQIFSEADLCRIAQRYREDIDWFEKRFPAAT